MNPRISLLNSLQALKRTGSLAAFVTVLLLAGCGGSSPDEEAQKARGKGDTYFNSGLYKEALDQYKIALNGLPNDARVYHAIAVCQERLNLSTEAMNSYELALEKDPNLIEAYRGRAFLLLKKKDHEAAEALLTDLEKRPGAAGVAAYLEGELAASRNRFPEAIEAYKKALEAQPDLNDAALALARAYGQQGDDAAAVKILQRIHDSAPDDLSVAARLAGLRDRLGENSKAVAVLAAFVERHPQVAAARSTLARLYLNGDKKEDAEREARRALELDPSDALALYVTGVLALDSGDAERAAKDIESALERNPDNADFKAALREARIASGEVKDRVQVALKQIEDEESAENLIGLAAAYLYQGEPDRSLINLTKVLRADPANVEAKTLQARSFFCLGKTREAKALVEGLEGVQDPHILALAALVRTNQEGFAEAVETLNASSGDDKAWGGFYHAVSFFGQKKGAEGLKRLDDLVNEYEDFGMPLYELARIYGAMGEPTLAMVIYRRLQDAFPDSPRPSLLLARLLLSQGKAERALVLVDGVLEKTPDHLPAKFLKGSIHLGKQEYGQARQVFSELLDMSEEDPLSRVLYRMLLAKTFVFDGKYEQAAGEYSKVLDESPENSQAYIEKALAQLAGDRKGEALVTCDEGLASGTATAVINIVKAVTLQQNGRADEALPIFESVEAAFKDRPEAAKPITALKTGLLVSARDYDGARKTLENGLLHPRLVEFFVEAVDQREKRGADFKDLNLGLLFTFYRWPDAALSVYGSLVAENPKERLGLAYLGEAQRQTGRLGEAYETFSQGVDADPEGLYFTRARASVGTKLGRFDEAMRDYLACLARTPEEPFLHYELARLYQKQGLNADSISSYRKAMDFNPSERLLATAANNMAWLLSLDERTLDESLEVAQMALEKATKNPTTGEPNGNILDTVGWIHFQKGNLEEAKRLIDRALRLLPSHPTINYHMGRLHEENGDLKLAVHLYLKALTFDPDFPEAEDARPRIPYLRSRIDTE